jgi:prephenate dehydrogenase
MKIVLIGLGLIGGSIAKTLSTIKNLSVEAFDQDEQSILNALKSKSIEGRINSLHELKNNKYKNALVIVATPPSITISIFKELSFLFNSSVTITDTSSTKNTLNKLLKEFNFPDNIIFSHPVAGSHLSGETNSMSGLFKNKPVILSHHQSVNEMHLNKVVDLWKNLDSKISVLDADLHDHIFAYTSHLPHVAAYALLMTLKNLDQENLSKFSGGGLGEFLRLSSSSSLMWSDIFAMNSKNIAAAIDSLSENLGKFKVQIEENPKDLESLLEELKNFKETNY